MGREDLGLDHLRQRLLSELAATTLASVTTTKRKSAAAPKEQKILYARLPLTLHRKLERLAAKETVKSGQRVTMQDVVTRLIESA